MNFIKRIFLSVVVVSAMIAGCDTGPERELIVINNPGNDTSAAKQYNIRAIQCLKDGDLDSAEADAKLALDAASDYGPAQNTLGLIRLEQGKLNDAARIFHLAATNMPRDPSPFFNLGLVWEKAGRREKAEEEYRKALKRDPENIKVKSNLVRALVLMGRKGKETRGLLKDVVLKDDREEWRDWAMRELKLMPKEDDSTFDLFEKESDKDGKNQP